MDSDLEEDDNAYYVPLSRIMEKILLHHYYLLTKREAWNGTDKEFDELDTYRLYTLLRWEQKAMKKEDEELAELEAQHNGGVKVKNKSSRYVPDDPNMVDVYNRLTNREEDN